MSGNNGNAFRGRLRSWEKPPVPGPTLLLLLWVGVVRAQEGSLQPTTSGVATNASSVAGIGNRQNTNTATGLFEDSSSDNSQVPAHFRPFLLTLPREHLLGDWAGLLPKLEDMGITPTLTYVSDIAGNSAGGRSQGVTYADNIGLGLLFDLDKLAGLNGGSFLVSMSQRDGNSLSKERVGNAFTIQQVYGGEEFHLIDLAYQQKLFDDRVELRLGRIGAGDDFLVCQYDYLFMQKGFDGNPVGIFFNSPGMSAYPNDTWGARLKVKPTKRTYIMAGIYNGDPSICDDDRAAREKSTMPSSSAARSESTYEPHPQTAPKMKNLHMILVESSAVAIPMCIVTMLYWGPRASTQKLASKKWQFYWDYARSVRGKRRLSTH